MMQEQNVKRMFDLTGQTVLLTGAGGYLGSAMGRGLIEAGARLIVTSRNQRRADAVAASLNEVSDADHLGVALDHMNEDSIHRGLAEAIERAEKIDTVVNNGNEAVAPDWSTVTGEQFTRQLQNTTGYFLLARSLREHLVSRSAGGNVIMIGSMYGLVASYPDAYEGVCGASPAAYHAMKGGIIHLTRHLAAYWARDGIRVNCLSPGAFPNPESAPPEMVERLCQKNPMRRMGLNHELKGAIVFLASHASSYMTGQNLVVDGGWTAW